ncbi:MAG: Crp/Fnr family transcriptional regulator [Elusimicrobiota bacterium]
MVTSILSKVALFSGMNKKQLKRLSKLGVIKKFKARESVFSEQETGDAFYVIIKGLVKIFKRSSVGEHKTLVILKEGDFFGEMAELDKPYRSASAQVIVESELLVFYKKAFEKIISNYPRITVNLMQTMSARLREADEQIKNLVFQNTAGRLAVALLDLSTKYGNKTAKGIEINVKLSHRDIADLVGSSRELVTKVMNQFKHIGCIRIEHGKMYIINKRRLKDCIY